jgi:hypothetical protein
MLEILYLPPQAIFKDMELSCGNLTAISKELDQRSEPLKGPVSLWTVCGMSTFLGVGRLEPGDQRCILTPLSSLSLGIHGHSEFLQNHPFLSTSWDKFSRDMQLKINPFT